MMRTFGQKTLFLIFALAVAMPCSAQLSDQKKAKNKAKAEIAGPEEIMIQMQSGIDKVIDLPFKPLRQTNDSIVVGNKDVVKPIFLKEKDQLILKPGKKGEASVTVRDQKGDIRLIYHVVVTPSNLGKMAREIREILRDVEGVLVKQVGEKILLDGEIVVPSDMNRIVAITQNYKDVINLTTFSPLAQKIVAQKMQSDIREQLGLDEVRVRSVNCKFFLEGVTDSGTEERRAVEIAKTYAPDLVVQRAVKSKDVKQQGSKCGIVSFITQREAPAPPPKKMIKVVTQFVELQKDYMKYFGFRWAPGIATSDGIGTGAPPAGGIASAVNAITGTINNLLPKLNRAKTSGKARVLETAVGITEDGQNLFINKQTQVPVIVADAEGRQTNVPVNYGLTVDVTPRRVGDEKSEAIKLQVKFVLSVPAGVGMGGVPVVTQNEVRNILTVNDKQSAAIAGVIRNGQVWAYNKDRTPTNALFTFLRSRRFTTDKSQFVIFITPILVDNASQGTKEIKRKFKVK